MGIMTEVEDKLREVFNPDWILTNFNKLKHNHNDGNPTIHLTIGNLLVKDIEDVIESVIDTDFTGYYIDTIGDMLRICLYKADCNKHTL